MISHQFENNGIVKRIKKQSNRLIFDYRNSIPVADRGVFHATCQCEDFHIGTRVKVLIYKNGYLSTNQRNFFVSSINKLQTLFTDYSENATDNLPSIYIKLPVKNHKIYLEFMESFIAELDAQRIAELDAYLQVTGLSDYELTEEETGALRCFDTIKWELFNLEKLFGKSTRGKRLKDFDRIKGTLPFVTAGEAKEGISAYISNDVDVFSPNTTTIDMFGSAKYRNYKYGADDHVAVVHTENLPKLAAIGVTTSIHKSSHTGTFSYSKNFYAKDADNLNIKLPANDEMPDYEYISLLVSAIQKLVIRDVVKYTEEKIEATKSAVSKISNENDNYAVYDRTESYAADNNSNNTYKG